MASKAILEMFGKKFRVASVSFGMSRNVESSGRTAGVVHGGQISISVMTDSKDTEAILSAMLTAADQAGKDGTISFYESGDTTKVLKKIEIKGGFVVDYSESYSDGSEQVISFTLTCHELNQGDAKLKQNWAGDAVD